MKFTDIAIILNAEFGTNFNGKQISQRWQRVDRPGLNKGCFSSEEDFLLK